MSKSPLFQLRLRGLLLSSIACLSLLASSGSAQGASALNLMVKISPQVQSIYISTVTPYGTPFTACRQLNKIRTTGWVDGKSIYFGAKTTVISFSSTNCTYGYMTRRDFVTPANSKLTNYWLTM